LGVIPLRKYPSEFGENPNEKDEDNAEPTRKGGVETERGTPAYDRMKPQSELMGNHKRYKETYIRL